MLTVYLVNALIGALIGFITNYLAIKMLFKPDKPVYIGKFRIPFTPGIIPKEKVRLAESIGRVVGAKLLTGDVLEKALRDEDIIFAMDGLVNHTLEDLEENTSTLRDVVVIGRKEEEGVDEKLCDTASRYLKSALQSEDFKPTLTNFLTSKIAEFMATPINHFGSEKNVSDWVDKGTDRLIELISKEGYGEKLKHQMASFIEKESTNTSPISDYLPEQFFESVKNAVSDNSEMIGSIVTGLLDNPQIEKNFMEILAGLMDASIATRMINVFVAKDTVYRRIKLKVEKYLKSEKGKQELARVINQQVDRLEKTSVGKVLQLANRDDFYNIVGSIFSFLAGDSLEEKFLKSLSGQIKKYILDHPDTTLNILIEPFTKGEIQYDKITQDIVDYLLVNYSDKLVDGIVRLTIPKLLDQKIAIFATLVKGYGEKSGKSLAGTLFSMIGPRAGGITKALNIPKLITDKVNEYDITEMEEIILSVIDRELKAVILLGALFGFVIGLAGPLISGLLM